MSDLDRLRKEYTNREKRFSGRDLYTSFNPGNLFAIQQRRRAILKLLEHNLCSPLSNKRILEVGCGAGGVLLEFLIDGASPAQLCGVDLLHHRLVEANQKLPKSYLTCADGQSLPYDDNFFDLVMQFTAFSSILDESVKQNMASEMLRVLHSDGIILWYDFWLNPSNPQTKGIRPEEVRKLFPNCNYQFKKVTLAPPIARRLAPFAWGIATFLESLKIFNSHYLAVIQKA